MICPTCHGIGEVLINADGIVTRLRDAVLMVHCPECGGGGFTHCCEGDCRQPEPENEDKK